MEPAMKRSPACGAEYPHEQTYCPADGALLYLAQQAAAGGPGLAAQQGLSPATPPIRPARRVPIFIWVLVGLAIVLCSWILLLIAVPTSGSLKNRASETSAIRSIRIIQQAETLYESTYPANGFACSLTALGGDRSGGAPSPAAAQLLPGDLASGDRYGYIFTIGNCAKMTTNGTERYTGYTVTAVPRIVGRTGERGFCGDQFGDIKFDPAGGTDCTQPLP
jgi:type IV pilus assembly protein PilA